MTKKEIKDILTKSNEKNVIAFDCFDTLIRRKYSINYVFYRLSGYLLQRYPFKETFEQLFLSLQRILNRCNVPFEILVKDVYLHYEDEIQTDFTDFLIGFKYEFESAEKDNALPTDGSIDLLHQLKNKSKKIYVISDFYIGKEFLGPLLRKLFGETIFDEILISSDYRKTKADGSLFSLLKADDAILMVGDNYESDFLIPQKFGIDCYHINSASAYRKYLKFDSDYKKRMRKKLNIISSKKRNSFAGNYGFILYFCMRKLYQDLKNDDCIYFLARDGLFLKKCFEKYLEYENSKKIRTEYLPTSRLALLIPSENIQEITPLSLKEAIENRTPWPIQSNEKLLCCLGLYESERKTFIDMFGNQAYHSSAEYFSSPDYVKLVESPSFLEIFKSIQNESKEKFLQLIKEAHENRLITMDLGWRGTSQNDMKKIIGAKWKLTGYYIGTTDCIGELENSQKKGLWFDYLNDNSVNYGSFYDLEALLKNKERQLISYRKGNDIYTDDSSTMVYEEFSQKNQAIAFDIFNKLIMIDSITPIPNEEIIEIFKKLQKKESFKDIFNGFYYYFKQDGGSKETQPKSKILKMSINLYFSRRKSFLSKTFFYLKSLITQK